MKIKDIINSVEKVPKNSTYPDWDSFGQCFYDHYFFDSRNYDWDKFEKNFVGYFHTKWICTDTMVGFAVWYLYDEVVAVSFQQGRKADIEIEFISEETANKVFEYMKSCESSPPLLEVVTLCDLNQDINIEEMPS